MKRDAVAQFFRVSHNRAAAYEPLPAIKQSADSERELLMRSWGFILLRDGYAPKRVTNTRDDKDTTKFWKDSFEKLRCLVPATAFCEPDEGKPAGWHWFALNGESELHCSPSPTSFVSGKVRSRRTARAWTSRSTRSWPRCEFAHHDINHERSPVLLTQEDEFSTWLTGTPDEAFGLIKTSDPERMHIVQSGFEKKDLQEAA